MSVKEASSVPVSRYLGCPCSCGVQLKVALATITLIGAVLAFLSPHLQVLQPLYQAGFGHRVGIILSVATAVIVLDTLFYSSPAKAENVPTGFPAFVPPKITAPGVGAFTVKDPRVLLSDDNYRKVIEASLPRLDSVEKIETRLRTLYDNITLADFVVRDAEKEHLLLEKSTLQILLLTDEELLQLDIMTSFNAACADLKAGCFFLDAIALRSASLAGKVGVSGSIVDPAFAPFNTPYMDVVKAIEANDGSAMQYKDFFKIYGECSKNRITKVLLCCDAKKLLAFLEVLLKEGFFEKDLFGKPHFLKKMRIYLDRLVPHLTVAHCSELEPSVLALLHDHESDTYDQGLLAKLDPSCIEWLFVKGENLYRDEGCHYSALLPFITPKMLHARLAKARPIDREDPVTAQDKLATLFGWFGVQFNPKFIVNGKVENEQAKFDQSFAVLPKETQAALLALDILPDFLKNRGDNK